APRRRTCASGTSNVINAATVCSPSCHGSFEGDSRAAALMRNGSDGELSVRHVRREGLDELDLVGELQPVGLALGDRLLRAPAVGGDAVARHHRAGAPLARFAVTIDGLVLA